MISSIIVDGELIQFIGGKPPRLKNAKARDLKDGYAHVEVELLDELKRRNFIYRISPIYAFIKRNIPDVKLSLGLLTGLARFFAGQLQIPIYREHYRRLNTCVFWMQMNSGSIKQYLRDHIVTVTYQNHDYTFLNP